MARQESEREDILREATALVERVELQLPGHQEHLVIGFRRGGAASIFFGADPVYQFNTAGELRRAYIGGLLYKAERGRLVALRRERCQTEVVLVRQTVDDACTAAILGKLRSELMSLEQALTRGASTIVGQVPRDIDVSKRITHWL